MPFHAGFAKLGRLPKTIADKGALRDGVTMEQHLAAQGSPFWRFSLQLYADSAFAQACLALQDEHGVDVNVLLFLLWAAQNGRSVAPHDVREIISAVEEWHMGVVVPLRSVRRRLRAPPAHVETTSAEALRQRIKAAELEAERLQQEALRARFPTERLGCSEASREAAAVVNLKSYAAVLGAEFADTSTEALLKVFRQYSPPAAGGQT